RTNKQTTEYLIGHVFHFVRSDYLERFTRMSCAHDESLSPSLKLNNLIVLLRRKDLILRVAHHRLGHHSPLQHRESIPMKNCTDVSCVIIAICAHHPPYLSMRIRSFSNECKVCSQNE